MFSVNHATAAGLALALLVTTNAPSFAWGFCQKHPRRAEVLGRDAQLNNRINRDYGKLGGNYGKLERQDMAIRRQEQRDARLDGGHITRGEQARLNREENHLNREVNRDYR